MDTQTSTDTVALDISLSDKDLLTLVRQPLADSKKYWDKDFGLEKARTSNMNLWLPNHWKNKDVYDYQEDSLYSDPRIFTSVETITANVNARNPELEVMPAQNGVISLQVAKDMQKTGQAYVAKYDVLDLFQLSARNLQLKRGGFIKLRWDPSKGQKGEIVSEFVDVADTIVDKDAKLGQIPRFFAHRIRNHTVEELVAMLPGAEQQIYKAAGFNRTDKKGNVVAYKSQMGNKLDVFEVWFRYMEDGITKAGVMWVDVNVQNVLDKDRNPNWNYDEQKGKIANFLDEPAPPFIPINYLNDGSSYFDLTSLIEQGAPLQRILDKRGFQIMENADQAGGGLVFNTLMISKKDIAKLVGSPDERIGVKGNVNEAVARVAPPPLPNYVIEDKNDARSALDNVFSTHDITRGESSGSLTLGQDQLQRSGDMTRMDEVSRAVERQAKHYFRYLFQMMKVYYTEEHYFVANGEDGQFDYIVMKGDSIENGADIRIAAGSMRMPDKTGQMKMVSDLVQVGLIDPLTVYEVMAGAPVPSPRKILERYMAFKTDPQGYMGTAKEDDFSREALMDIQVLNGGEMPKIRTEYDDVYLKFMNNYMLGGEFTKQTVTAQAMYREYLRLVKTVIAQQLALAMSQLPTADEMQAQNQQTAQQAALHGQIQASQPPEIPGVPSGSQGAAPAPGGGGPPAGLAARMASAPQGAPQPAPAPAM